MNYKLLVKLSLFGLGMAIGTVYFIPSNIEPLCWLAIMLYCAYCIAKNCTGKYFFNGFCLSLLNCIWVTGAHVLLCDVYLAGHDQEAKMLATMPMPEHPRLMMLVTGPFVGIASGLVLGLFCFVASKIVKK